MSAIAFDSTTIHDIKQVLAAGIDARSSHLTEAIAAALGFGSNAALAAAMACDGFVRAIPDAMAATSRLRSFDRSLDERRTTAIVVQALVYGIEFSRRWCVEGVDRPRFATSSGEGRDGIPGFADSWIGQAAEGCRALYEARENAVDFRASIDSSLSTATRLARLTPLASPHDPALDPSIGMTVGRELTFDPFVLREMNELPLGFSLGKLVMDGEESGDELGPNLPRPRSLRSIPSDASVDETVEALSTKLGPVSELEGMRIALWLAWRVDDRDVHGIRRLIAFSQRRLPYLSDAALAAHVVRRFGVRAVLRMNVPGTDSRGNGLIPSTTDEGSRPAMRGVDGPIVGDLPRPFELELNDSNPVPPPPEFWRTVGDGTRPSIHAQTHVSIDVGPDVPFPLPEELKGSVLTPALAAALLVRMPRTTPSLHSADVRRMLDLLPGEEVRVVRVAPDGKEVVLPSIEAPKPPST